MKQPSDMIQTIKSVIDPHDLMIYIKRGEDIADFVPEIVVKLDNLPDYNSTIIEVDGVNTIASLMNIAFNAKCETYALDTEGCNALVDLYHSLARCLAL